MQELEFSEDVRRIVRVQTTSVSSFLIPVSQMHWHTPEAHGTITTAGRLS